MIWHQHLAAITLAFMREIAFWHFAHDVADASYYHGMEGVGSTRDELDGLDMRKSMPRDKAGKYVRSNGRDILVSPDQVWA